MRLPSVAILTLAAVLAGPGPQAAGEAVPSAGEPVPEPSPLDTAAGLLPFRPQLPAKLPFLFPALGGGTLPAPGESRFQADLLFTSTLQYTRGVIVSERPDPTLDEVLAYMDAVFAATGKTLYYYDGETTRLALGWRLGLPAGWEIGVDVPVLRHDGGWVDGEVGRFHGLLGLSDAGRDSAPGDVAAAVLISQDGGYRLTEGDFPTAALGDVALRARCRLPPLGAHGIDDLTAAIELPTGDPDVLAGSGGYDASLAWTAAWTAGRSRWTVAAGYARLGGLDSTPDLPTSDTWALTGAYELRIGTGASFLAQILHGTSPYASLRLDGLSDPAGLIALGMRFAAGRRFLVDAALVEDLYRHNTDLDIGLVVGVAFLP